MKYLKHLLLLITISVLIFSCYNQDEQDNINNNETFSEYEKLQSDDLELINFKKTIKRRHTKNSKNIKLKRNTNLLKISLDSDNIDWSKAFKREEGKLKGIFIPIKNVNENEIIMVTSLLINGKNQYFLVKGIKGKSNRYITRFFSLGGHFIKQLSNKSSKSNSLNDLKLNFKISSEFDQQCSTTNGCIDDYEEWFNDNCSNCNRFGNNSDQVITYVTENGDCRELYPGEYTETGVDGFKIGNTRHKVTNGYNTFGVNGEDDYDDKYNVWNEWYYENYGGDLEDIGEKDLPYWDCLD